MGKPDRRYALELLVSVLFAFGIVLGYTGFAGTCDDEPSALQCHADALYSTLQLIVLNVGAETTHGPTLGVARILLPASVSVFVLLALWGRARQWGMLLWLHTLGRREFPFSKPVVLVLGCGEHGLRIARFYASRFGLRVVGIAGDGMGEGARRFRSHGFAVLESAVDREIHPRALPLASALWIIVSADDDNANLDIATGVLPHLASRQRSLRPRVLVCSELPGSFRAAEFDSVLAAERYRGDLQVIDLELQRARLLYRDRAPHRYHRRLAAGATNPCHVVLLIGGRSAEAFLVHAVRALVYSPSERLRVTALSENAEALERRLRLGYPALWAHPADDVRAAFGGQTPLAEVNVLPSAPLQINVRALLEEHDRQPADVIYVMGRDDRETGVLLAEAIKAADLLQGPRPTLVPCFHAIPVGLSGAPAFASEVTQDLGLTVDPFILDDWVSSPQGGATSDPAAVTPDAFNDELAVRVAALHPGPGWEALAEHERWWNRHAADHALVKLALLQARAAASGASLEEEVARHIDWLSALEHRRYVCERMSAGWLNRTRAGGKVNRFHLNPTLRPYDALPLEEREKDTRIVELLRLLDAVAGQAGAAGLASLPDASSGEGLSL